MPFADEVPKEDLLRVKFFWASRVLCTYSPSSDLCLGGFMTQPLSHPLPGLLCWWARVQVLHSTALGATFQEEEMPGSLAATRAGFSRGD